MADSYPLKPYDSDHDHVPNLDDSQMVAHASPISHPFSISRNPISQSPHTNNNYTALVDPHSSSNFPGTQPQTRYSRSSILRWWLPEIGASIFQSPLCSRSSSSCSFTMVRV